MIKTIGVDVGHWKVKTSRDVFNNGIEFVDCQPSVSSHTGIFENKWFKAEETRIPLDADWLSDDRYRINVLLACIKELRKNDKKSCHVNIALGCPLKTFGVDGKMLREYILKKRI